MPTRLVSAGLRVRTPALTQKREVAGAVVASSPIKGTERTVWMSGEMRECPCSLFEASAPSELAYACGQPEANVSALMSNRRLADFKVRLHRFRESQKNSLYRVGRNWTTCV